MKIPEHLLSVSVLFCGRPVTDYELTAVCEPHPGPHHLPPVPNPCPGVANACLWLGNRSIGGLSAGCGGFSAMEWNREQSPNLSLIQNLRFRIL